jgi:phosphatidylserine/phosphatidylglycerophosphate/cardiolipin synthase-like enzyme
VSTWGFVRACAWVSFGVTLFSSPGYAGVANVLAQKVGETLREAQVSVPADQEVCFSPDEPCDLKLVKWLGSAEKSLDIAIFDLTLDALAHQILLKSRKIPVRVLVDRRQAKGNHSLVRLLVKAGVKVRLGKQRGVMHNKFTVLDGRMIETGSFNYTFNGYRNNNENQVYLSNPLIVKRFRDRFEQIWSEGKPLDEDFFSKR